MIRNAPPPPASASSPAPHADHAAARPAADLQQASNLDASAAVSGQDRPPSALPAASLKRPAAEPSPQAPHKRPAGSRSATAKAPTTIADLPLEVGAHIASLLPAQDLQSRLSLRAVSSSLNNAVALDLEADVESRLISGYLRQQLNANASCAPSELDPAMLARLAKLKTLDLALKKWQPDKQPSLKNEMSLLKTLLQHAPNIRNLVLGNHLRLAHWLNVWGPIPGNLRINWEYNDERSFVLPDSLEVGGDFVVDGDPTEHGDSLSLVLGKNTRIGGSLSLELGWFFQGSNSKIVVGENLSVGKNMRLYVEDEVLWRDEVVEIPGNLTIEAQRGELPRTLKVGSSFSYGMDFDYCDFRVAPVRFPQNTIVLGEFSLSGTTFQFPPNALCEVKGRLYLEDTRGELPSRLHVDGDLEVKHASFVRLPAGLNVEGDLTIDQSGLQEIGRGVLVSGNCDIFETYLRSVPADLEVGGDILIRANTLTLETIPRGLHVRGKFDLSNNPRLQSLPPDLRVDGDLIIVNTAITSVPETAQIGGEIIRQFGTLVR